MSKHTAASPQLQRAQTPTTFSAKNRQRHGFEQRHKHASEQSSKIAENRNARRDGRFSVYLLFGTYPPAPTTFEELLKLIPLRVPEEKAVPMVIGERKTILTIDDEPSVLELLTDIFTEAKFTVIGASDPIEGIKLYRKHQGSITMVILDYSMPGMDGKAAFEELIKINKDVKVLLCSGYTEERVESAFGDVRPAGFIHKPYQPAVLLERMSQVLAE